MSAGLHRCARALALGAASFALASFFQADVVPTDIQQPGTQPSDNANLEAVSKCDNCHAGYDPAVEPYYNWAGSPMAQAGRDPLFWATVAVAEQSFGGSGDLCLRCHAPNGWLEGRSTPTDGSGLAAGDADGVACDLCHRSVNPDESEFDGLQLAPFLAHDGGAPPTAWYGSGMFVVEAGGEKLGPYSDPASPHASAQSLFHRSSEFCGTCHDVSNPAVGDLAPTNGAIDPLAVGTFSGVLGAPVDEKAAFNNPPFAFGTVERTFSEHMASAFPTLRVADYALLPPELQHGVIEASWALATAATPTGDYVDGAPRFFTCQTCHLPPVTGKGCNKASAPVRSDLPHHDMTGGNAWIGDAIQFLDSTGDLVLGGGLTATESAAIDAAQIRAVQTLQAAAHLSISGNALRVVNLTGHKLPTGFPEGRRMWLRVSWYDALGQALRIDGEYGPVSVMHHGAPLQVDTLLDLDDPRTVLYEAQPAISQEWAATLVSLGTSPNTPLRYDRLDGSVTATLGGLAQAPAGTLEKTFHFVLNDSLLVENRIPPYGLRYDDARTRNALPVPDTLYGNPGTGGVYEHWDEVALQPPSMAEAATIELLYQTTSWEFVQFLELANNGSVAFLADTGGDLLDAWLATGMSAPVVMATANWVRDCNANGVADLDDLMTGTSLDVNANGVPDECETKGGLLGRPPGAPGSLTLALGSGVVVVSGLPPGAPVTLLGSSSVRRARNAEAAELGAPLLLARARANAAGTARLRLDAGLRRVAPLFVRAVADDGGRSPVVWIGPAQSATP